MTMAFLLLPCCGIMIQPFALKILTYSCKKPRNRLHNLFENEKNIKTYRSYQIALEKNYLITRNNLNGITIDCTYFYTFRLLDRMNKN